MNKTIHSFKITEDQETKWVESLIDMEYWYICKMTVGNFFVGSYVLWYF